MNLGRYKKVLIIATMIIGFSFILFSYLNLLGSTYRFGIPIEKYKHQISQFSNVNSISNKTSKYSWKSSIILPESKIKVSIEHLVPVNSMDKELNVEIVDNEYFMSMIEADSGQLISVSILNYLDGEELPETCTKLYRNGKGNKAWIVSPPLYPDSLNHEEPYLAIGKIYQFPKKHGFKLLELKSFLFNKGIQKIAIVYYNSEMKPMEFNIEFEIRWYKQMTWWERALTVT
jgi:hypothetical protein